MRKILIAIFLLLLAYHAEAASLGISNPDFNFRMPRSGYEERAMLLSTDSEAVLNANVEVSGQAAGWITANPSSFNVSRGSPRTVNVIVHIPEDAENGNYTATVRFAARREFEQLGNENVVMAAILANVRIEVGGPVDVDCTLVSSSARDTEAGIPFEINALVENRGRTRITAPISVRIRDDYNVLLEKNFSIGIAAGNSSGFSAIVPHNLPPGRYFAMVSGICSPALVSEFRVLEEGSLEGKGELLALDAAEESEKGSYIPFSARFANTGEVVVSARLILDIYYNGRLEQTVETNEIFIASGQSRELVAYFVPGKPGSYEAVGRVYYNDKFSGYKREYFSVSESENGFSYIVIAAIIAVLSFLIYRKRSK